MDYTWLALTAPLIALPALVAAGRLEEIATRSPRKDRRSA